MRLKRGVNFEETLFGDALAQDFFASQVADDVQRDAAQRGTERRHGNVKQHALAILVDVGRNNEIHGHAEQRAVGKRDHEHAP